MRNLFVERLWPSVAALAVGVLIGCALGLVVWLPWPRLGFLVGAVACCGIVAALLASSSRIAVTAGDEASGQEAMLEAGGARIEVGLLGKVEVLGEASLRQWLGLKADARAHLCQRPWVKQGLRVVVADPHDPVPYWLITSRRPQALARALGAAQEAHSEQTSWPPSS